MNSEPAGRAASLAAIRGAILPRQRFVISSHARPDGDSIGSQLAMAHALRWLGKTVRVVNADPAPPQFAAVSRRQRNRDRIRGQRRFRRRDHHGMRQPGTCTGVDGLDRYFVINVDHHPGNTLYGALNWFDESAAACAEMVFDVVGALEVPLSLEIATHLPCNPDGHRGFSLLAHLGSNLRHLPSGGGSRRERREDRANDLRQQHARTPQAPRRGAREHGARNRRTAGFCVRLSQDMLVQDRRVTRGLRGTDQPTADGQGNRSRGLLQRDRTRALSCEPQVKGRRRRRRGRKGVRRRRPPQRRRVHDGRRYQLSRDTLVGRMCGRAGAGPRLHKA